ncbi:hypothetical protein FC40_GL000131 [Ligilactobacillus hayakitensis DSM 18933 = JCM 14209]|uniref:DUF1797 domain-containing protein n=1 Tax=Ligilactobacillus hayakitensis DSM 18933 = JCM 14209 TaxID=1423755 RepID=A0A0R1WY00_9LACO|nr:YkuJ family protein [Ligilactobacillus hayakitensis]KRM20329.1 hypothetical protein FC40_GL000131 [Ligilactobacillus hayakitensis DSM 18933 = JCM 14209]
MENSQLVAIITRLDAMAKTESDEIQTRRFEKNGEERGLVQYDPATSTYTLEDMSTHQKFGYDDIDMAAMDIYDLLND